MYKNKEIVGNILAAILGLGIPVFFSLLDIWELELEMTFSNLIDVLKSQNIYIFSFIFFPIVFIIITQLILKVRLNQAELEQEFNYLKVILNSSPDAIIFLDENQKPVFQNNQFRLLFNDLNMVLNSNNLRQFFKQVEFLQKEINIDSNLSLNHPFLMNFKLAKYKGRQNYFISLKDLKKLKDKEHIIESQKHQMIENNKLAALGEMAAGIAHEINNPLTVIHSNNTLIHKLTTMQNTDPEKILRLSDKTKDQIERITTIITSLRNLSRGLANQDLEDFSLDLVITEAIDLAKLRDKGKRIIFQFNNQKSNVYANRGQVVQVVLNLLNNAIDAIEEHIDPWISIEIIIDTENTSIFITDSGKGIPEETIKKMFIPLYTTKDVGKGTGLGLSLSRSFIEDNNGELIYLNNNGNTCFKITLPNAN